MKITIRCALIIAIASIVLSGCGGGTSSTGGTPSSTGDTPSSAKYSISVNVIGLSAGSLTLLNNGGDSMSISTNGVSTFSTALVAGSAYSVTVNSQPAPAACWVESASGIIDSSNLHLQVTCQAQRVYVGYRTGSSGNQLNSFALGSAGALSDPTTPISTIDPLSIAITPSGKYAYVANYQSSGTVSQYSVNSSGTLTSLNPSTAAGYSGGEPRFVVVSPSGKFLYVVDSASSVSNVYVFSIGASGVLTLVGQTPAGGNSFWMAIDPSEKYAYVINSYDNTVSQFSIATNGLLVPMTIATVSVPYSPQRLSVHPSGKYLYVLNSDSFASTSVVSQFAIGSGGQLTSLAADIPAGNNGSQLLISLSGNYLYAASNYSTSIYIYAIGSDGALSAGSTPSITAPARVSGIATDRTGTYLYTLNYSGAAIYQFSFGAGGVPVLGSTTPGTGTYPGSITVY